MIACLYLCVYGKYRLFLVCASFVDFSATCLVCVCLCVCLRSVGYGIISTCFILLSFNSGREIMLV